MASSTHNHHQQLPTMHGGATSAPPPTPNNHLSTADTGDTLSRLLHRLPPTLSLPTRRSTVQPPTKSPPLISFSSDQTNPSLLNDLVLSSSSQLGFFQLTNHSIPSQLAASAESEAISIFNLPQETKESCFPKNWPLGYQVGDDDEEGENLGESFCFDSSCLAESAQLSLASLSELARSLEKVGLRIVELLSSSIGFECDPTRFCSLVWLSEGLPGSKIDGSGGFYPYIVGLQYQIRCQKYSFLADSGWVSVLPQVDSVQVTIGDIAQVWSNGKLKKVRGRPVACLEEGKNSSQSERCITMTLLVTLPLESRVYPLIPKQTTGKQVEVEEEEETANDNDGDLKENKLFNSFSFEDYAWRVYHDRFSFKDPLDRYRI
ncbi:hypothetical protein UlMin_045255 [Ulmus minor]